MTFSLLMLQQQQVSFRPDKNLCWYLPSMSAGVPDFVVDSETLGDYQQQASHPVHNVPLPSPPHSHILHPSPPGIQAHPRTRDSQHYCNTHAHIHKHIQPQCLSLSNGQSRLFSLIVKEMHYQIHKSCCITFEDWKVPLCKICQISVQLHFHMYQQV